MLLYEISKFYTIKVWQGGGGPKFSKKIWRQKDGPFCLFYSRQEKKLISFLEFYLLEQLLREKDVPMTVAIGDPLLWIQNCNFKKKIKIK